MGAGSQGDGCLWPRWVNERSGSLLPAVQKVESCICLVRAWLEGLNNGGEKGASLPCPKDCQG